MATATPTGTAAYPTSDGQPVAETQRHLNALFDVYGRLTARYADAADGYVAANLFVYYVEGEPEKVLAPDVFVAFGVENRLRETYKVWDEGVFPSVVFEVTSKSSKNDDMGKKFALYRDVWKVKEYFLFDPLEEYLEPSLLGYRRVRRQFEVIPAVRGRVPSKVLGLTLERDGEMLALRDAKSGERLLLPAERQATDAERRLTQLQEEVGRRLAQLQASNDQLLAELTRVLAENAELRKGK